MQIYSTMTEKISNRSNDARDVTEYPAYLNYWDLEEEEEDRQRLDQLLNGQLDGWVSEENCIMDITFWFILEKSKIDEQNEQFLDLRVAMFKSPDSPVKALEFGFSFVDNEQKLWEDDYTPDFKVYKRFTGSTDITFPNFFRCNVLDGNRNLQSIRPGRFLAYQITMDVRSLAHLKETKLPYEIEKSRLFDHQYLFETKENSDVRFVVEGKAISAHKKLLAEKSPAFYRIFFGLHQDDLGIVQIEDIEYDVFEEMCRYVYIGEIRDLREESVQKLFIAANRYSLIGLEIACEEFFDELNSART